MPTEVQIYKVFVSSPSDVGDERDRTKDIIDEINASWGAHSNIRLELIRWETHGTPGLGIDAQSVLNETMPADYDIFVGIMWSRFGTPTARAESGTLEEFLKAKERYENDPNSVRVMFYFKDQPIPPSEMDPEQLKKINEFKKEIGTRALYTTFQTTEDFERLLRIHLAGACNIRNKNLEENKYANTITIETEKEDDEPGLIDSMISFKEHFINVSESFSDFHDLTVSMTSIMNSRTDELEKSSNSNDLNRTKRIFDLISQDMNEYADNIKGTANTAIYELENGINSMIDFIDIYKQEEAQNPGEIIELIAQIDGAQNSLNSFSKVLNDNITTLASWRRMTKDLNKAKRKLINTLEETISGFSRIDNLISEIKLTLFSILKN